MLCVLHPDSHVEIFGDGIDVRVEVMLDGQNIPEAEATAEAYLEATLPPRFRALHYLPKLAGGGQCERRTPETELQRLQDLRVVRALRPPAPKPKLKREAIKARLI